LIPRGFGQAREHPFWGGPPKLEIGVDPSRFAESAMLEGLLTQEMAKGLQDLFNSPRKMTGELSESVEALRNDPDADPSFIAAMQLFSNALDTFMTKVEEQSQGSDGADDAGFRGFQPVEFVKTDVDEQRRGPRNFYAVSFPQGILWGIMGCAAGFGISLVSERTSGTLVRLRMSPISRVQILAGKGLACLLTVVAVCVVMLVFAAVVFQVRPTTPALLPAAIASVAICFVGVMMLLAVVGKTERAAGGIGWAILTVMAMIGGGMVPVFIMPAWMQGISTISPVRWAIIAIEGAVWRSYSVAEMWLPCVILLSIGVGCFAIGARAFRWTEGA
jgi:ABC-2 type transport system permease protein